MTLPIKNSEETSHNGASQILSAGKPAQPAVVQVAIDRKRLVTPLMDIEEQGQESVGDQPADQPIAVSTTGESQSDSLELASTSVGTVVDNQPQSKFLGSNAEVVQIPPGTPARPKKTFLPQIKNRLRNLKFPFRSALAGLYSKVDIVKIGLYVLLPAVVLGVFLIYQFLPETPMPTRGEDPLYSLPLAFDDGSLELDSNLEVIDGVVKPVAITLSDDYQDATMSGFVADRDGKLVAMGEDSIYISKVFEKSDSAVWGPLSMSIQSEESVGITPNYLHLDFEEISEDGKVSDLVDDKLFVIKNFNSGVKQVDGYKGKGVTLDGSIDSYLTSGNITDFPQKEVTISYLLKTSGSQQAFFSYATERSSNELLLFRTNSLSFYRSDTQYHNTGIALNNGEWNHLVVTWAADDGLMQAYVNGELRSQIIISRGREILPIGNIVIGGEQDAVGGGLSDEETYRGELDEVMIWDRRLDQKEIQSLSDPELGTYMIEYRSCNLPTCDDAEFVEYSGDLSQDIEIKAKADDQYFQYRLKPQSGNAFPKLSDVTVAQNMIPQYSTIDILKELPLKELTEIELNGSGFEVGAQVFSEEEYMYWDGGDLVVAEGLADSTPLAQFVSSIATMDLESSAQIRLVLNHTTQDAVLTEINFRYVNAAVKGATNSIIAQTDPVGGGVVRRNKINSIDHDIENDQLLIEGTSSVSNNIVSISTSDGRSLHSESVGDSWEVVVTDLDDRGIEGEILVVLTNQDGNSELDSERFNLSSENTFVDEKYAYAAILIGIGGIIIFGGYLLYRFGILGKLTHAFTHRAEQGDSAPEIFQSAVDVEKPFLESIEMPDAGLDQEDDSELNLEKFEMENLLEKIEPTVVTHSDNIFNATPTINDLGSETDQFLSIFDLSETPVPTTTEPQSLINPEIGSETELFLAGLIVTLPIETSHYTSEMQSTALQSNDNPTKYNLPVEKISLDMAHKPAQREINPISSTDLFLNELSAKVDTAPAKSERSAPVHPVEEKPSPVDISEKFVTNVEQQFDKVSNDGKISLNLTQSSGFGAFKPRAVANN